MRYHALRNQKRIKLSDRCIKLAKKKPSILFPFVFIFFVFHAFMRLSRYLRLLSLSGLNL